jgi:hypothetical protein
VPPAHAKGAVPPYDAGLTRGEQRRQQVYDKGVVDGKTGARLDVGLVNLAEHGTAQLMANYMNGYNKGSGK